MSDNADFGRAWEYTFWDANGIITVDRYPTGLGGRLDSDEAAWRAADLLKEQHGITVTRIQRKSMAGQWEDIPVLSA